MSVNHELSGKRSDINVGLLPPAYLPEWFWLPTLYQIDETEGYNAFIPQPPREKPHLSLKDYVDSAASTLGELESQYIVCLSRSVEFAVRYINLLRKRGRLNKVAGLMVISSVGPRGYETISPTTGKLYERHSPEFNSGISIDNYGFESLDSQVAETILVHDIEDENLRSQTIKDLTQQRPLTTNEIRSVPYFPKGSFPVAWYIGSNDKVDNKKLSAEVAKEKFGVNPIYKNWGHVGPLSHTSEVTQAIIKESHAAISFRKARGFYVVVPKYPERYWADDIDSVSYMNMRRTINQDFAEEPVDFNIEGLKWLQKLLPKITFADRIVDFGSGNGMPAAAAAELTGTEAHILGIEPNHEAIRLNSFLPEKYRSRVTLFQEYGEHIPWMPDNFATAVTAHNVIFRANDSLAMLSELRRILKPDHFAALSSNAQRHAEQRHGLERMVARIVATEWGYEFDIPTAPAHGHYLEDLPGIIGMIEDLEIVNNLDIPRQETRAIITRGHRLNVFLDSIVFSANEIILPAFNERAWRQRTSEFRKRWRAVVMEVVKPYIEDKIDEQAKKDAREGIEREPFFTDTIKRGLIIVRKKS